MSTAVLTDTIKVKKRKKILPNEIIGMIIFIFTEIMFFTALMSAYVVIKKDGLSWAAPENIKLPVMTTAFNTFVLFLSGFALIWAERSLSKEKKEKALSAISLAAILGSTFVFIQGYEWIQLLKFGMTMNSSIFGAMFFLLIGVHGVHALSGILAICYGYIKLKKDQLTVSNLRALLMFWALVVVIWPFLYKMVYF